MWTTMGGSRSDNQGCRTLQAFISTHKQASVPLPNFKAEKQNARPQMKENKNSSFRKNNKSAVVMFHDYSAISSSLQEN